MLQRPSTYLIGKRCILGGGMCDLEEACIKKTNDLGLVSECVPKCKQNSDCPDDAACRAIPGSPNLLPCWSLSASFCACFPKNEQNGLPGELFIKISIKIWHQVKYII